MMDWLKSFTAREIKFGVVTLAIAGLITGLGVGGAISLKLLEATGTLLVAAFTGTAVVVAWLGFKQNEKTSQTEYRAYVEPALVELSYRVGKAYCRCSVRNYGRTPARHVKLAISASLGYTNSGTKELSGPVLPREFLHPSDDAVPWPEFSLLALENFILDKSVLLEVIVHLHLTYTDVFGEPSTETEDIRYLVEHTPEGFTFKKYV